MAEKTYTTNPLKGKETLKRLKSALRNAPVIGTVADVVEIGKEVLTGDYAGAAVATGTALAGITPIGRIASKSAKVIGQKVKDIWSYPEQLYDSAATSINVVKKPSGYNELKKRGEIKKGETIVDIGGGRFDNVVNDAAKEGATVKVYDPFNRSPQHNKKVVEEVRDGKADVAMSHNVLNVIKEDKNIIDIVKQAENAIKPNGKAHFSVYEGDGKGVGKITTKGYQRNEKTEKYLSLVESVFGKNNVVKKGKLITATKQSQTPFNKGGLTTDEQTQQAFNQGGYGVAGKFTPDTGVSAAKEKGTYKGLGYKGETKKGPKETKPYGGFQESVDMSSKKDDNRSVSASVTLDRIKKDQLAKTKFTPANFQSSLSGQFDQSKKVDPETYSGLKFQQTDKDGPLGFLGESTGKTLKQRQEEVKLDTYFQNLGKEKEESVKDIPKKRMETYSNLGETKAMAKARVTNSLFTKFKENERKIQEDLFLPSLKNRSNYSDLFPELDEAPLLKTIIDFNIMIKEATEFKDLEWNEELGKPVLKKGNPFISNLKQNNPQHYELIKQMFANSLGVKKEYLDKLDKDYKKEANLLATGEDLERGEIKKRLAGKFNYEDFYWCSAFINELLTLTQDPNNVYHSGVLYPDAKPMSVQAYNKMRAAQYFDLGQRVKKGDIQLGDVGLIVDSKREDTPGHLTIIVTEEAEHLFEPKGIHWSVDNFLEEKDPDNIRFSRNLTGLKKYLKEYPEDQNLFFIGVGGYQTVGGNPQVTPVVFSKSALVGVRRFVVTNKVKEKLVSENPDHVEFSNQPLKRPKSFSENINTRSEIKVKSNDSMAKIAQKLGIPLEGFIKLNKELGAIENANKIKVGQTLYYNKGGLTMEQQMNLFKEGGMKDDGLDRDPVSGNEIPPGSLAKEVRDDIPAQLSEGEYVVPADVVQYYGVKFFEDLRMQAKRGLAQMAATGRIGGEPVSVTMIAIGEEEKKKKKKYLGGPVGFTNGGVSSDVTQVEAGRTYNPDDFRTVGGSLRPNRSNPANQQGVTRTVTYYNQTTGEAHQVTFVNNTITPPEDVQYTKPPQYSLIPPSPTNVQAQRSRSDDNEDRRGDSSPPGWGADPDKYDFTGWDQDRFEQEIDSLVNPTGIAGAIFGRIPLIRTGGLANAITAMKLAESRGIDTTGMQEQIDEAIKGMPSWEVAIAKGLTQDSIIIPYIENLSNSNPSVNNINTGGDGGTDVGKSDGPTFPNVPSRVVTSTDKSDKKIGVDTGSREQRQSRADDYISNPDVGAAQQVTEDRVQAQRDAIDKGDEAAAEAAASRGFKKGGLLQRSKPKPKTRKPRGKGLGIKK